MSNNEPGTHNAFEWMKSEYKADPSYWKDRAINGSGIIREIANFVIEQAGKAVR